MEEIQKVFDHMEVDRQPPPPPIRAWDTSHRTVLALEDGAPPDPGARSLGSASSGGGFDIFRAILRDDPTPVERPSAV